jgi:A/G-specific adenine glycosylase
VLIVQRRQEQMLGGLWAFPGGKQKPGESLTDTVDREVAEATGLQVRVNYPYCQVRMPIPT